LAITANKIKKKAIELSKCSDFIASKGWLDKFKVRYNLDIVKEGNRSNPAQTSSYSVNTSIDNRDFSYELSRSNPGTETNDILS
jgi:hypothetical protein